VAQYPSHNGGSDFFYYGLVLSLGGRSAKMPATFFLAFMGRIGIEMAYSIFARDGTSRIVLKRQSREAAEKKARELTDLGWFDVQIAEEVRIKEAEFAEK
jgi:hypothetical protein